MARADDQPWRTRYDAARAAVLAVEPAGVPVPPEGSAGLVDDLRRLCHAVTRAVEVSGAAVTLMASGSMDGVVASTDALSRAVEELQFTGGDGPCHLAYASRRPVLIADLGAPDEGRWPGYTASAIEHGFAAVFSLPLFVGGAVFGVLDLLCERPGPLGPERLVVALTYAHLCVEILTDGRLIGSDGGLDPALASALDGHAEIHQAQGMSMIALDVTLTEALARMRARAFGSGRPLAHVAREILAGRETLD